MDQKSLTNHKKHSNIAPKSWNIVPWRLLGAGGSWGHLGPKRARIGKQVAKSWFVEPPWPPQLGLKILQKSVPGATRNVINFLIDLKIDSWSDLVPSWPHLGPQNPPKMETSWIQNWCKLECWFAGCFFMDLGPFFIKFSIQRNMAEVPKVQYVCHFWHFFDFLLCCLNDWLIDFWLIFDRFGARKSSKNLSKMDQKSDQK